MLPYEIIGDSADREAWLELRRTGIGASDVPSILQIPGAWGSPLHVAADKLGALEERPMTEYQEAGLRMEAPIAAWAVEDIKPFNYMHWGRLLRSTKYPWLICTPDFELQFTHGEASGLHVPLQIKNTVKAGDWKEEPPPAVIAQCLTEQIVTGVPFSYCATLLLGNRLRWAKIVRADYEELCAQIIEETGSFWEKVQSGKRIEVDASEKTREAIAALWPAEEGKEIALDGGFVALDSEREAALSAAAEYKVMADGLSNEIREAMGDAEVATLPNGVVFTYKQGARSRPLLRKPAPEE